MKPQSESKHNPLLNRLREIFKANPKKKTITVEGQCSECGYKVMIKITATSEGFGLEGGSLLECSPDGYLVKCLDCYKSYPDPSQ